MSELKDNINAMIGNLRETTERNTEQDWLKTNLAKFSRMMQGQRDLVTMGEILLAELAPLVGAQQAILYIAELDEHRKCSEEFADLRRRQPRRAPRTMRCAKAWWASAPPTAAASCSKTCRPTPSTCAAAC